MSYTSLSFLANPVRYMKNPLIAQSLKHVPPDCFIREYLVFVIIKAENCMVAL